MSGWRPADDLCWCYESVARKACHGSAWMCLEIPGHCKERGSCDWENQDPPSTPSWPGMAELSDSSTACWFRRTTTGSWISPLVPEEDALWEMNVGTWSPLAVTPAKRRLKTVWLIGLPLTSVHARGRHLLELSSARPALHCLAARSKGELQAGWTWNTAMAPPAFQVPRGVLSTTWNWGCFKVQMQCVFVLLLFAPEYKYQLEARRCGALQTLLTVNKEKVRV